MSDVIIIGAGGHGKVIADIIRISGDTLLGFLDDYKSVDEHIMGFPILGKVDAALKFQDTASFIIGIGSNQIRRKIADQYHVKWYTAIHPTAVIAADALVEEGTMVMANAVINVTATVGKHCIINTGAIVEHDNEICDFAHLSPRCVLGGKVHIGELTHVGLGAVVKNNTNIGSNVIIGAGAVVVKDITETGTYIGVPARKI